MRVAIDESGEYDTADLDTRVRPRCVGTGPNPGDSLAVDENRGVGEYLDRRHLLSAARARRAATRHDLPRADEQCLQSRSSFSGRRMWCRRAVSMASG